MSEIMVIEACLKNQVRGKRPLPQLIIQTSQYNIIKFFEDSKIVSIPLKGHNLFKKFATYGIGIATIVVAVATIVVDCDNCDHIRVLS